MGFLNISQRRQMTISSAMEAVDRTSDVGVLLVTTLELFTVGSSLLYCDNKFRFEGMCLAPI